MDPAAGANATMVERSLHVYDGQQYVIVRSTARPEAVAAWVRSESAAMDPTVPATVAPLADRVRGVSERPRFNAFLLSLFAVIAVALAAAGVYGLMSFLVAQRTREIGIRMAVGATPAVVARLVVWDALQFGMWGIVVGVAGAVVTARSLKGILFGVSGASPLLLSGAALVLLGAAVLATLRPSLRAARVDPVTALRQE
jgi:ABC-type antimicrobial peptide transport system permease subunit